MALTLESVYETTVVKCLQSIRFKQCLIQGESGGDLAEESERLLNSNI